MKHEKLPQEIAARIPLPPASFDAMPEEAQQVFVTMAHQALLKDEELEKERKRADEEKKRMEAELELVRADELKKRRGVTVPIADIGTTRSITSIRLTDEWRDAEMEFDDQRSAGLITEEEYKANMAEVERDLIKQQDTRKHRERRAQVKKSVARVSEHIMTQTNRGYMKTVVDPTLLDSSQTIDIEDGLLVVPTQQVLEKKVVFMLKTLRRNAQNLKENHSATVEVNLFFHANNRHPSYTHNMVITHASGEFKDNWYDAFRLTAHNKLLVFIDARYEELEEASLMPQVTIHANLHQFEDIKEWFDDVKPGENIRNMGDFIMNLCAAPGTCCEQQAVEHFGRIYDPSKKVRENLETPCTLEHEHSEGCSKTFRVVVYSPIRKEMRQVTGIDDFIKTHDEAVDTNNCTSVARLVVYKSHIGVIAKIKGSRTKQTNPGKKGQRMIHQMALNTDDTKFKDVVEVFLDFETFRRRWVNRLTPDSAVPYLVCWSDEFSDEVHALHSENIVRDFVDMLFATYSGKTVVLLAWNGSGFDHQLLMGELMSRKPRNEDNKLRDNRILMGVMHFDELTIVLKDPMLFIPRSLAAAAKDFGVITKGDFPHDLVNDNTCMDQVIRDWYTIRITPDESSGSVCGKIMLVTAESHQDIIENNNTRTVMEKAIEYCKIDVSCVKQIWKAFKQSMMDSLGVNIPVGMMTLPQLAFGVLKSKLPKGVKLLVPTDTDYNFIRRGQYGGRVMAKKGVYGRCIYVDVVSEYPSVMWLYDHPYGSYYKASTIDWSKLGIYDVTLKFKPCEAHDYREDCTTCKAKREQYTEFLPRRVDGKLKYDWLEEVRGVWCTYDLEIAIDEGYVVTEVHEGYEWRYKGKIFAPFIETVKHIKENAKSPAHRCVGKLIMNSPYGKMSQKPHEGETFIVPRGVTFRYMEDLKSVEGDIRMGDTTMKMPTFHDLDDHWEKMTVDMEGENMYPTQNSVFILAGARKFLRNHLLEIRKHAPNVKHVYSDTDSLIIVEATLEGYDPIPHFGTALGQLDDTVVKGYSGVRLNQVVVAGKKMYGYEYTHPVSKKTMSEIHVKGVPKNLLTMNQMQHMLANKDNKVRFHMMLMKKNLVGVNMVDISREIGLTGANRRVSERCVKNQCSCRE